MIICIGELLADMICERKGSDVYYKRCVGGAPFNVACAALRMGADVGFAGCVGDDAIGRSLYQNAAEKNFSRLVLRIHPNRNTTLAFVDLSPEGERAFTFYRKNTADYAMDPGILENLVCSADIVHLGSLMLSEKDGRLFASECVREVRKQGKLLSFDVNFRSDIFPNKNEAAEIYSSFLDEADILKLSEDELELFSKDGNLKERMMFLSRPGKLIVVTLGREGAAYLYNKEYAEVASFKVVPVDTTGAGDAFFGALLAGLDKEGFQNLYETVRLANACGALTTTQYGSAEAVPSLRELNEIIR